MKKNSRIYVAGHRGLVGSAIVRVLQERGFSNIITASSQQVDLRNAYEVRSFFDINRPEYVFLCAAKVGGIQAHLNRPVDFYLDNALIQANVMHCSKLAEVKKLLFLGSACAYPKYASNPIREDFLLTGELEPSNEGYALAKIAGIKACDFYRRQHGCNFVPCMPTNLYGPGDNYDLETSHVLPGIMHRMFIAARRNAPFVTLWGTGLPTREFLYSDDLADACLFLMEHFDSSALINVGSNQAVHLVDLAELIKTVVGYKGSIRWDATHPDGTPERMLDNSRLQSLGWAPQVPLTDGLRRVYKDFLNRIEPAIS